MHQFHVTPAGVGEMLTGGGEFLPPQTLLGDLTETQATTVPADSVHSIAVLVGHMHFWQERGIALAHGDNPARPAHLDDTFPALKTGDWESLRTAFLNGLETCTQLAAANGENTSAGRIEASVGYDLAACPALHNAYHFGQIVILRQILGFWPLAGGDGGW